VKARDVPDFKQFKTVRRNMIENLIRRFEGDGWKIGTQKIKGRGFYFCPVSRADP
jgi:hypothetical protein